MLRSMFTAISALTLHQDYLDVVANNLANANTPGYKGSRVLFQDQFSQTLSPGASPNATQGGLNPTQIGLGVQLGYVSPVFTQGMIQNTGKNTDLAIQGDGFFIYGTGDKRRYSREGSMSISDGFLVNTSTGLRVQGWTTDKTTGAIDTNLPPGDIQFNSNQTVAKATGQVVISGNLDANTAPGGKVSTTLGVYDSLGNLQTVKVDFTRSSDPATSNQWTWNTNPAGTNTPQTVTFDPATGHILVPTPAPTTPPPLPTITIPGQNGAPSFSPTVDLSNITMLSTGNSVAMTTQDGLPPGQVTDVVVTPNDGCVYLVYSNGMREEVAQLALARFANPAGLVRAGQTTFQQGLNSGNAEIGTSNTGGRGTIATGSLEGSNVDMAQEFTNMILAQRGFQASSRVITTSDEILQELVNLKR